jgi:hypothetical protein
MNNESSCGVSFVKSSREGSWILRHILSRPTRHILAFVVTMPDADFVVRMPDAEVVGLRFIPWVPRSSGDLGFFLEEVTEKLDISKFGGQSVDAPANRPKVAGVCRR